MGDDLLSRAIQMRNALDGIELALMGYGDLVEMPRVFEGTSGDVRIHPVVTVEQMRRVCEALSECTRIVNSDEYTCNALEALSSHKREAE